MFTGILSPRNNPWLWCLNFCLFKSFKFSIENMCYYCKRKKREYFKINPFIDYTPLPPKEVKWKSYYSSLLKYDKGQNYKVFLFFYPLFPSSTSPQVDFYFCLKSSSFRGQIFACQKQGRIWWALSFQLLLSISNWLCLVYLDRK